MNAYFEQIPPLEICDNGTWTLHEELVYYSAIANKTIVVPQGFETDLASIPAIFTPLIPKNGLHRAPAIVHDYLCREKIGSRKVADKIFLEAMSVAEVPIWRKYPMYWAVSFLTFVLRRK